MGRCARALALVRREEGQSLVLVALWLTVLLGFAALAIDVGRLYSERRFLQNAADAAALAGAAALIQGRTAAEAEAAARAVLTRNFQNDPTGNPPALPSVVPLYEEGHAGEASYLKDGVLVTGNGVWVAVKNPVNYTFGRALGVLTQDVGARARAGWSGGLMPIAVRRYVNAPGPNAGVTAPCPHDETNFMDFFATANTACLGSETDAGLRTAPSAGNAFDTANPASDPTNHGPVVTILGQGAQPQNGADFRGFIALDVRNFQTTTSQQYYNGVTAGTNPNTLKHVEAAWIGDGGYPGPAFPAATSPPDPMDQVGILPGNSTGIAIDAIGDRFTPGDEILVAVYPGNVMAIPDFALAPPDSIGLPATGTSANPGSLKVSRNQAFSGMVDLSTEADALDPQNPMVLGTLAGGAQPITYDPDPVTPALGGGATVQMRNVTTNAATPGIYALWVRGQAGSPYLTTKRQPFAIRVGNVTRDFSITADASRKDAPSVGSTVTFNLVLTDSPNRNTAFGGPVTLSVDGPYPAGTGSVGFSSASVTPSRNGTSSTLSINTGTLPPGEHDFIVRATGTNGDPTPRKVTRLLPLTVNVAPTGSSGNQEYLDIVGFAVMRIAAIDANAVTAYAITPVVADPSDPRLRRGQTARLLPWP